MEKVYLTKLAPNCGCAAKVGRARLRECSANCRNFMMNIFLWEQKPQMMRLSTRSQTNWQ